MTIFLGSDHGGFELKKKIQLHIQKIFSNVVQDFGVDNGENSVDYPDLTDLVCKAVLKEPNSIGILVCGSGQGVAMRANKYSKIRAALVWDKDSAKLSRQHNNANVLCLGGRLLNHDLALELVDLFLQTPFEGGRHQGRLDKISSPTDF